jgi:hypothetical protein
MSLNVARYDGSVASEWDAFVRRAKNATFLFERGYMDYHADRFADHSLVVRDAAGRLVAVFPADRREDTARSHGGLTYGGFVIDEGMTLPLMGKVFACAAAALRDSGITRVLYKTVPRIYHTLPADEDAYWLFRCGARLYRRDVLTVSEYGRATQFQERRARSIRKARNRGILVRDASDFADFWTILDANLRARYGVAPVHSVEEIQLLAGRFPEAIRLAAAYQSDTMVAGAVAYVSRNVCHVQYNAASEAGKEAGALDLVLDYLLTKYDGAVRYFDFGASTEQGGRQLNEGLVDYKEGFGARTVVHDMYEWDLTATAEQTR